MNPFGAKDLAEEKVRYAPDLICCIDRKGRFVKIREASRDTLGYDFKELEGKPYINFVLPDDRKATLQVHKRIIKGNKVKGFQNRYIHKSGKVVSLRWSAAWYDKDGLMYCAARYADEAKQVHKQILEKKELYQALIEHSSDMLALLDKEGNYLYVGGSTTRTLGYESEELQGINAFSLIHPEDLALVQEAWSEIEYKEFIKPADFRFKKADGSWLWIEAIVSNQLRNPAMRALVVTARDITERKTGRLKLEESEQKYKALFSNNPDIIFFEDINGIVTEANNAFCTAFGLEPGEITGKPASSFLPAELVTVNQRSLQEALLGSTMRFDLEYVTKAKEHKVFDTVKFPVVVNSKIVGAQTIAKDITPIVRSFDTIQKQAKKLNSIFESITDAFFSLDNDCRITYANSVFAKNIGRKKEDLIGTHICEIFPQAHETELYKTCLKAAETKEPQYVEESYPEIGVTIRYGIYPSNEGISVYSTDITKEKEAQQEIEKLSLVANKTTNGVILTDKDYRIEWANEGFTKLTGYSISEAVGKTPEELLKNEKTDSEAYKKALDKLEKGENASFDAAACRKDKAEIWLSLDINPVKDENGQVTGFIVIQTDITDIKTSEIKLKQMTQDLYHQNKDLQQFTYIVSHNLRAPAANALGLASLLTKADNGSKVLGTFLSHLKKSLVQMDTVLRDVNTILSVRDRQDILEKSPVVLIDVFKEAYAHLQEPLLNCGGQVIMEMDESLSLNTNRAYLYSIFYNLLSNAIKYRSPERTLEVKVKCYNSPEKGIVLSFTDNGLGFDMQKAGDDVFKLYKRFHKDIKGRGIGLFLVKTHVEAMGGKIEVSSHVDAGTKFLIYLPQ